MADWSHKSLPPAKVKVVEISDEGDFGPAMRALGSDRQRAFVYALVRNGGRNAQRAYLEAGFIASTNNGAAANAHRLAHDERVQLAIREEGQRQMGAAALAATSFLTAIVNEDVPAKMQQRMRAAEMILNRTGLHEHTEHKVTVEKRMNPQEKIDHAVAMAKALGLDPKKLLGAAGVSIAHSEQNVSDVSEAEIVSSIDDWTALP